MSGYSCPVRHRRGKAPLPAWGLFVLLTLLAGGCDLSDPRDECCEEVRLIYRYVRTASDEYRDFISSERHFLFDGDGRFVREVPSCAGDRRQVRLRRLPEGEYTMVTVGNASEARTVLADPVPGATRLEDFRLAVRALQAGDDGTLGEADELFWNSRTFRYEAGRRLTYLCDMANIHCHLYLRVTWEDVPPAGGADYSLELSRLTPGYTLQPDPEYDIVVAGSRTERSAESDLKYVVHRFPRVELPAAGVVRVGASLRGHELYPSAVTLRYRDDRIPTVQLLHDGTRLFHKPIDLAPIFREWGWLPSRDAEQIYRVELRILRTGLVEVLPWVDADVMDWEDGGSFGG